MSAFDNENRPGRPRKCPPCPLCGRDEMRSYGSHIFGHMSTRFCGCQNCQHTDVWVEPVNGGHGYWKKAARGKNLPTTPCGASRLRVYTHAQLCGPTRLSWRDAEEYPGVKP